MATLDFAHREITARIVYFGATGAGSNTNLRQLHKLVPAASRSQLHKFGPRDVDERSYYFDYTADGVDINGFAVRFRVYSLPGELTVPAHREEVMRDVDAIGFVADARPERETHNLDGLLELEKLLSLQGIELATLPVVLQVNHTDAESARRPQDVTFDLNPYGVPVVPAVATAGVGVLETHAELTGAVMARIRDNLAGNDAAITLNAVHRATRLTDEEVIRGHLDALQERTSSTPESMLFEDAPATQEVQRVPEVRVAFQPRELVGSRPVQIVAGRIVDDRIHVDVLMQRMGSDEVRLLTVVLENRPTDTPPVPRHAPPVPVAEDHDSVADYLPERFDLPPRAEDLPPVLYGLVGIAGGILIGLLAGYLLGVVV